jgi:hypothetical protein
LSLEVFVDAAITVIVDSVAARIVRSRGNTFRYLARVIAGVEILAVAVVAFLVVTVELLGITVAAARVLAALGAIVAVVRVAVIALLVLRIPGIGNVGAKVPIAAAGQAALDGNTATVVRVALTVVAALALIEYTVTAASLLAVGTASIGLGVAVKRTLVALLVVVYYSIATSVKLASCATGTGAISVAVNIIALFTALPAWALSVIRA